MVKGTEISMKSNTVNLEDAAAAAAAKTILPKPPFRPAQDDTKPLLQDPILRSDPIETEEAVLRLPPFPIKKSNFPA